ncbi:MAG: glycosyl transferase, group 1 family protein [Verrucomicrobia bacterium]|jgi:glycosyltransferase involved in cell wall biosynthesis|nr:glycosyl transferase, group 1 family protein [Verrucomicrobiota bacterium]
MRILLVHESARCHTGGANRVVVETLALLASAGHQVALAYTDGQGSEVQCPVYRISVNTSDSLVQARWEEIIRDFRPDIVQVHQIDHPFFLQEAGAKGPLVRFLHDQSWFCSAGDRMVNGFEPCHRPHATACLWHHYASGCGGKNPAGNWQRWQRVQRNFSQGRQQRFQVASEFMARGLEENGIRRAAIDVVCLFARKPQVIMAIVPGLIVVASRLVPAKGVHLVLDALAELRDVPCSLVIAGDGPERGRLEAQARSLGITERVRFLGEVSPAQVDAELAKAELVLTPTLRPEPFGLIGPEAMAHGKPLLAFDGGATPEWLQSGVNGAMLSERSAGALAAGIRYLFSDRSQMQAMGQKGYAMWQQKFSAEVYTHTLVESFERLVQRGSPNH